MKTTPIILAGVWIVTLVTAYTIGSKIGSEASTKSADRTETREDTRSGQRSSARNRAQSSNGSMRSNAFRTSGKQTDTKETRIVTIMRNSDPVRRAEALLGLINRLGADEYEQVVTDFRAMGITDDRMSEYAMLMHAWGKIDPLAALEFAKNNTGTSFARQTVLASWAADSPDAALSWAQQNHKGEDANPWLIGVIRGLVTSDPIRATEIMEMLPYSRERGEALSSIVPYIAKMEPEKISEWLQGIRDERLRQSGATYLAGAMASQDPEAAAEWVLALTDPEAIRRAAGSVAGKWASVDLDAALAWTDSLPGEARSNAAREVIYHYASKDPAEAATWLRTLSNQEDYDRIVTSYIWSTSRKNPELSLAQVPQLEDARSQQRYYERILSTWHRYDANAANAWMDANNTPEALRRSVQKPRESRR